MGWACVQAQLVVRPRVVPAVAVVVLGRLVV